MITHLEIVNYLVFNIAKTNASDLVKKCIMLGMRKTEFQDIGLNSQMPSYETGYHFKFNPDNKEEALFEILEKDKLILQAGYQLILPRSFNLFKQRNEFDTLNKILELFYGKGLPMKKGRIEFINYANTDTVAYLSRFIKIRYDAITMRVGNKFFWK